MQEGGRPHGAVRCRAGGENLEIAESAACEGGFSFFARGPEPFAEVLARVTHGLLVGLVVEGGGEGGAVDAELFFQRAHHERGGVCDLGGELLGAGAHAVAGDRLEGHAPGGGVAPGEAAAGEEELGCAFGAHAARDEVGRAHARMQAEGGEVEGETAVLVDDHEIRGERDAEPRADGRPPHGRDDGDAELRDREIAVVKPEHEGPRLLEARGAQALEHGEVAARGEGVPRAAEDDGTHGGITRKLVHARGEGVPELGAHGVFSARVVEDEGGDGAASFKVDVGHARPLPREYVHRQCKKLVALPVHIGRVVLVTRAKEPAATTTQPDGRHARAERTRGAIVDALLSLLEEGVLRPSAERVAERAGVSRRALFNHFADHEDLLGCAVKRRMETVRSLWPVLPSGGTTEERARVLAEGMCRFHEQISPVRRSAVLFAQELPFIATQLREAARIHRAAIFVVFAPEIEAAPQQEREALLAGLTAAASFSMWEELRRNQELSVAEAHRVVRQLIEGLLDSKTHRG